MNLDHLYLTPTRRRRLEDHATRIAENLNINREEVIERIAKLLIPHTTTEQLTTAIARVRKELTPEQPLGEDA